MPRPNPPPLLPPPTVCPFQLGDAEQRDLARVMGLSHLPPEVCEAIAAAIANYKATEAGSADTTIGNTLAELVELTKKGPAHNKAVKRIADDRSGIDYTTHSVLQPLARAVQAAEPGAREALAQAASERAAELREHKRVLPSTESLRFFCGLLREIFKHAAAPTLASTIDEAWHHCRQFAMEVFTVAGIDHADFQAHPERLTEYLGTDVSPG